MVQPLVVALLTCALLWIAEPALRQSLLQQLATARHINWWIAGGVALLGGSLAVGLVARLRQRSRARAARLRSMQEMDPLAFERQVGQIFTRAGYRVSYTLQSGDEGIDLWLERVSPRTGWHAPLPVLNTLVGGRQHERIPVQCKRYGTGHAVGSPDLQRFSGALRRAGATQGYFVTTSRFTPAALTWARKEGIHLLDGRALLRWQEHLLLASATPALASTPEPARAGRDVTHD